ncbi:MAG: hypothetical protein ACI9CB_000907, partial [Rhodothermales bacterium]
MLVTTGILPLPFGFASLCEASFKFAPGEFVSHSDTSPKLYPSPLAESSGLQGISYTLPYGFLALRAASFKIA